MLSVRPQLTLTTDGALYKQWEGEVPPEPSSAVRGAITSAARLQSHLPGNATHTVLDSSGIDGQWRSGQLASWIVAS